MRKVTLACDRCKKEVEELLDVAAGIRTTAYSPYHGSNITINAPFSAEWCSQCCKEVGFRPYKQPPLSEKEKQSTLESLIREIIREEMEER
jgi:hypothetical protein